MSVSEPIYQSVVDIGSLCAEIAQIFVCGLATSVVLMPDCLTGKPVVLGSPTSSSKHTKIGIVQRGSYQEIAQSVANLYYQAIDDHEIKERQAALIDAINSIPRAHLQKKRPRAPSVAA